MTAPLMTFAEVRELLKQRFPMIMVDTVVDLVPDRRIRTTKNVTGNEIQFLGHFPDYAIMPGTLIVEAFGQSASILFLRSTTVPMQPGDFLVLGLIRDMRFLAPVFPGDRLEINVNILKIAGDITLVEGEVSVDATVVARGQLGFAKRALDPGLARRDSKPVTPAGS
ncbi:MAG: 3-hydroxyacyl-ACP dehydratase FabZ [Steroidobacteraceae bacterium]|jgi:3-hydroxyacyl-[acyl-carrier-protein] dehydratase|nr:3-hydroxyacyl-ACP dehydratase FabZ [Steroidobacteraceae bacterium]